MASLADTQRAAAAAALVQARIQRIVAKEQETRERDPMLLDLVVQLDYQYVESADCIGRRTIIERDRAGTELYIILRGECEVLGADGK
eukprot:COSAG01_NODE_14325_length_1467_cov_412.464912_2_plen_88_part_00